jgi:hypothetical protein
LISHDAWHAGLSPVLDGRGAIVQADAPAGFRKLGRRAVDADVDVKNCRYVNDDTELVKCKQSLSYIEFAGYPGYFMCILAWKFGMPGMPKAELSISLPKAVQ